MARWLAHASIYLRYLLSLSILMCSITPPHSPVSLPLPSSLPLHPWSPGALSPARRLRAPAFLLLCTSAAAAAAAAAAMRRTCIIIRFLPSGNAACCSVHLSVSCEYHVSGCVCLELCRRGMRECSSIRCAVSKVLVQPRAECRASMRRISGSTLLCLNVFRQHRLG